MIRLRGYNSSVQNFHVQGYLWPLEKNQSLTLYPPKGDSKHRLSSSLGAISSKVSDLRGPPKKFSTAITKLYRSTQWRQKL